MGWTVPYDVPHRKDLIAERVADQNWTNPDGTKVEGRALKHCYRGGIRKGTLYIVWERTTTKPGQKPESMRFIEVDLLECYNEKGGGRTWGYKDIDCCMGPCETSCPLSYLELCAPHTTSNHCAGWHEKVRAYHAEAEKARNMVKGLKKGDVVELRKGCHPPEGIVQSLKPFLIDYNYRTYKCRASLIVGVKETAKV